MYLVLQLIERVICCSVGYKEQFLIELFFFFLDYQKMGNKLFSKKLFKEDLEFLCSNIKFIKVEIKDWYRGFMV